ncbi:transposase [Streptomyces cavernicola]|uniref:Transposase n=1 Tax=Streptomyces cavernicola TaxID=3043613 RepID=A0ABT6SEF2_9ACTN|nr:transposase [Streptomyces sp. B-S-A6]MDI3406234.1 transposase [Streptomyces sp. B-S-A6]
MKQTTTSGGSNARQPPGGEHPTPRCPTCQRRGSPQTNPEHKPEQPVSESDLAQREVLPAGEEAIGRGGKTVLLTSASQESSSEAAPRSARRAERGRRTPLGPCVRGRLPHPRQKEGAATGPSPVDRWKTGSKHHLICDGKGIPLHVIMTAANVNDITQTLHLVDGIPPVSGRVGHPCCRLDSLLGDEAHDSKAVRG